MIKTKSIAGVFFLEIEEEINEFLIEAINFRLTNIPSEYNAILDDEMITAVIGLNEIQSLKNIKTVVLNEHKYDSSFDEFDPYLSLEKILVLSEYFCQSLWLVKDNSVQFELAHLIYGNENNSSIHSNFWNSSYSMAIGTRVTTSFSKQEINDGILFYKLVLSTNLLEEERKNKNIILTNKISRLTRAFYFLKSARTTNDLGTKISHYCSILESLFSISTNELKHRLSENVAFFLSKEFNERNRIYKIIQTSYDIRSSVVHGDGITTKFLKNDGLLLINNVMEIDNILRLCFRKIMTTPDLYELFTKKDKIDISNYFQDLIFK